MTLTHLEVGQSALLCEEHFGVVIVSFGVLAVSTNVQWYTKP